MLFIHIRKFSQLNSQKTNKQKSQILSTNLHIFKTCLTCQLSILIHVFILTWLIYEQFLLKKNKGREQRMELQRFV